MAVYAQQDRDRSSAANGRPGARIDVSEPADVDLRTDPSVTAGTFEWRGPDLSTGWHRHPYHQLEYAFTGTIEVETTAGRYLLPPQQAVWIPAGLAHTTRMRAVHSVSAFIDPSVASAPDDRARVLAAAPVLREMLAFALRWPIGRPVGDPAAEVFFAALATVTLDRLDHESPLHLPTSDDPVVAAAVADLERHLDSATATSTARRIGVSERTLRRRFVDRLGVSWQDYLRQCRLLRAAALLAEQDRAVIDVATTVGFDSPSSFTRAFRHLLGETPSEYRRRMRPVSGR